MVSESVSPLTSTTISAGITLFFNRRMDSIPDIPGIRMSISTIFGLAIGTTRE